MEHGPRDLEFSLTLSPIPRRIGDTMQVTVRVRNLGSAPARVKIGPCYLTYKGIQPQPTIGRPVCAAASREVSLAAGQSWTLGDSWELTGPPGRYPMQVRVAQEPPVWLGTDLHLKARSGGGAQSTSNPCPTTDVVRMQARLSSLKKLMSGSDSAAVGTRRALGIRAVDPADVKLVALRDQCARSVTALNTVRHEPETVRQIWLYALGSEGYAVDAPHLGADYVDTVLYFLGPDFSYKGTDSGFR